MSSRPAMYPVIAGLLALCAVSTSCGGNPTQPSFVVPTASVVPTSSGGVVSPQGPAPLVTGVSPATGSTFGGASAVITGSGFQKDATVTFDGANARLGVLATAHFFEGALYVETPPHVVGPVTVVVTNPDGQSTVLSNGYTYAPPGSFDFNGEWEGGTGYDWLTSVRVTIHNDIVVAVACGGVSLAMSSPLPTISDGEFSVLKDGAVVMTGRIVSNTSASGRITSGACARQGLIGDSDKWVAKKGS